MCNYKREYNLDYPYVLCYNYSYNNQQLLETCPRLTCINEIYTWIILMLICIYAIQIEIIRNILIRACRFNKKLKNK